MGAASSFVSRQLRVTFQLASDASPSSFPGTKTNQIQLTGLRASARVLKAGFPSMGSMDLTVWGMTLDQMNTLSTLGMKVILVPRNLVTVEASNDSGNGFNTVFIGQIFNAYPEFNEDGNAAFHVQAQVTANAAVVPSKSLTFKEPVSVASVMATLANVMGLVGLENNGVTATLPPSYFWGSPWQQAGQVAKAAGIGMTVDNNTLIIWPRNGTRVGSIPLISPSTGMIGYPSYTAEGLHVDTIYNPNIAYQGMVEVKSSLQRATGKWGVFRISYFLESNMEDGGKWESNLDLWNPAFNQPIPTSAGP